MGGLEEQASIAKKPTGLPAASLELSCWHAVWALTILTSGFGFPIDTRNIYWNTTWGRMVDWPQGQAIYETSFSPYLVKSGKTQPYSVAAAASEGRTVTVTDAAQLAASQAQAE